MVRVPSCARSSPFCPSSEKKGTPEEACCPTEALALQSPAPLCTAALFPGCLHSAPTASPLHQQQVLVDLGLAESGHLHWLRHAESGDFGERPEETVSSDLDVRARATARRIPRKALVIAKPFLCFAQTLWPVVCCAFRLRPSDTRKGAGRCLQTSRENRRRGRTYRRTFRHEAKTALVATENTPHLRSPQTRPQGPAFCYDQVPRLCLPSLQRVFRDVGATGPMIPAQFPDA